MITSSPVATATKSCERCVFSSETLITRMDFSFWSSLGNYTRGYVVAPRTECSLRYRFPTASGFARRAAPGGVRGARGARWLSSDYLIHPEQERRGDGKAERLGSLEVDDQLELPGLLHRQIGRLRALEDLVHIDG